MENNYDFVASLLSGCDYDCGSFLINFSLGILFQIFGISFFMFVIKIVIRYGFKFK